MLREKDETIAQVVHRWAQEQPERVALIFEGAGMRDDVVLNYGQLWNRVHAVARGLHQTGLKRGDVLATLMANHAEFVELLLASSLIGIVIVPIDPRTRGEKLSHMLSHVSAAAVVVGDYALAQLQAVREEIPSLRWVAALATDEGPDANTWPEEVTTASALRVEDGEAVESDVELDSPMEILFTSGTTGDPKGIVMTHRRFYETAKAAQTLFGYQRSDRLYSGLSLTHANAQLVTLGAALFAGLSVVFSRRFTKKRLWDITRQYSCTTFTLLGGMTTAVYSEPRRADDADHPVRLVVSAGMPVALWKSFGERFGVQIAEFYGAAEGGLAVNPPGVGPAGSCGRLPTGAIGRIVDEDGNDVSPGNPGELLIGRSDGTPIVVEYLGNAEASAQKCAGGWLHTGDIVRADVDGWLYFLHRKGGGIRRNGDFINTAFIERAIADSGLVEDVYIYGVAAASGAPGEKDVVAAVVPSRRRDFDPQAVIEVCRAALEPNFVPNYVHVLENIPKTASEKPQDRFLQQDFEEHRERVHTARS